MSSVVCLRDKTPPMAKLMTRRENKQGQQRPVVARDVDLDLSPRYHLISSRFLPRSQPYEAGSRFPYLEAGNSTSLQGLATMRERGIRHREHAPVRHGQDHRNIGGTWVAVKHSSIRQPAVFTLKRERKPTGRWDSIPGGMSGTCPPNLERHQFTGRTPNRPSRVTYSRF